MPTTIAEAFRVTRKPRRCQMCARRIHVGTRRHVQTNVYDGRVYDFTACVPCTRDNVILFVWDYVARSDEGVDYETAAEWASDAVTWPRHWLAYDRAIHPAERLAARAWLARAAGGEGE